MGRGTQERRRRPGRGGGTRATRAGCEPEWGSQRARPPPSGSGTRCGRARDPRGPTCRLRGTGLDPGDAAGAAAAPAGALAPKGAARAVVAAASPEHRRLTFQPRLERRRRARRARQPSFGNAGDRATRGGLALRSQGDGEPEHSASPPDGAPGASRSSGRRFRPSVTPQPWRRSAPRLPRRSGAAVAPRRTDSAFPTRRPGVARNRRRTEPRGREPGSSRLPGANGIYFSLVLSWTRSLEGLTPQTWSAFARASLTQSQRSLVSAREMEVRDTELLSWR